MASKVFVSWPGYSVDDADTGGRLLAAGLVPVLHPKLGARSEDELLAMISGCAAAIVSTDPFSRRVIAATPDLRIIARVGVGTDSIDRAAADEHRVAISITPGLNAETVADHTLALLLALVRKLVEHDRNVKAGGWERVGRMTPGELPGKTIGIVGAGTIGRAVMRRLSGFGVRLVYVDAFVEAVPGAERLPSLDVLLSVSDIVSLHAPLTDDTRAMIDAAAIGRMKEGALLVNTARGGHVDQTDLFAALRSGRLGGAALDVFEAEPPGAAALADVPNLVTSPHVGGLSVESIRRMTISATDSVIAVLSGARPDTVINPGIFA